jgi:hypothetical protein
MNDAPSLEGSYLNFETHFLQYLVTKLFVALISAYVLYVLPIPPDLIAPIIFGNIQRLHIIMSSYAFYSRETNSQPNQKKAD